ncbi:TPA: phage tail assembly chaperone [Klebsiella oxytoca]
MSKNNNLRDLALAPMAGFRHKEIPVPEWGGVKVVIREPSAEGWINWRTFNEPEREGEKISIPEKTLRSINADVALFIDTFCDTDLQRVFTPTDQAAVAQMYGPVHSRLLKQALDLITSVEDAKKS